MDIENLSVASAHVNQDGSAICELRADATALVEVTLDPRDASVIDAERFGTILDWGSGTELAYGHIDLTFQVKVDVLIDPNAHKVQSPITVSGTSHASTPTA